MLLNPRVKQFGYDQHRGLRMPIDASAFVGLLDLVPNAAAAYSVARKLRAAYAGSAIRLREDAGNTEMDFGFTGANFETDVAAIAAWIAAAGATNAYVVTLYDQSGNGRDASQSTAGNQPLFNSTGAGGKPSAQFDGTNHYLVTSTFSPEQAQPNTVLLVGSMSSASRYFFDGLTASKRNAMAEGLGGVGKMGLFAGSEIGYVETVPLSLVQFSVIFNGASSFIYKSGTQQVTGNAGTNNLGGLTLGARYIFANKLDGQLPELILWNSLLSDANRQTGESNQDTYY